MQREQLTNEKTKNKTKKSKPKKHYCSRKRKVEIWVIRTLAVADSAPRARQQKPKQRSQWDPWLWILSHPIGHLPARKLLPLWISKPCDFVHVWNWITSAASKLMRLWKLFATSAFSINSLDVLVSENMMFAEAGSSSSDLKGLLGICGKQYCDIFFFILLHISYGKWQGKMWFSQPCQELTLLWEYSICQSVSSMRLHLPGKYSPATLLEQKLLSKA